MFRRVLWLIIGGFLLAACASVERFQQFMDSYIGQPISVVQEAFGYDYSEHQLDANSKAYTWQWSRQGVTPGYRTPTTIYSSGWSRRFGRDITIIPGTYYPPTYYEQHCEFTFIVDANERVTAWRALGEGCTSYRPVPVLRSKPAPIGAPAGG